MAEGELASRSATRFLTSTGVFPYSIFPIKSLHLAQSIYLTILIQQ